MVGLLGLVLAVGGCQRPPSGSASTPAPVPVGEQASKGTPTAEVVFFPSSGGAPLKVRVEVARTQAETMRGLMFRKALDPDAGMLFLFDGMEIRRFWMRNTYIPLDMIFLDDKKTVVGIAENTIPLDETGRGPDHPAQFVVEVQGGYTRQHGIGLGSRAEFHGVD